jgi:predicted nuclease with TOPRIM domain
MPQGLAQEQIMAEINQLQQKNAELYEDRSSREEQRQQMVQEYEAMIQTSVDRKAELKGEVRSLSLQLGDSLMRPRPPSPAPKDASGIRAIMGELSDLNGEILQKIGSFKEATRDALAHCERAALDRYKPKMEELLERIYENAVDLPVDEIRERFNNTSDEIELQIQQLQVELTAENGRNERLQMDTRRLEDRVTTQKDEVARMRKEYTLLGHEITLLNDVAVQEIASFKIQYQRLLKDQQDDKASLASARAVVVSGAPDGKRKLARVSSQPEILEREVTNPTIPSVEEFIVQERTRLLEKIRRARDEPQ